MFRRITIHEAKKRFKDGKLIVLCPCKMFPTSAPFASHITVHPAEHLERAAWLYKDDPGEVWEKAWKSMFNSWAYYNASYECGYYAHYYVEE